MAKAAKDIQITARRSPEDLAAAAERTRQIEMTSLRRKSNVPPMYAGAGLDSVDFVPKEIRPKYLHAVKQLRRMLTTPCTQVMVGDVGPGKTHLACALVFAFCDAGRSARYHNTMDFFIDLQGTYGEKATESYAQVLKRYQEPDLLVLDEITQRGKTNFEDRTLTLLVNNRHTHLKSTLIVGNLDTDLVEYFGKPIADRIREYGGVIRCDWPSLRGLRRRRSQEGGE